MTPGPQRRASVALVGAGGGIGALARYELGLAFAHPTPPSFPTTTLIVNLTGSFLLGMLLTLILEVWRPAPYVRAFAGVGLLGGYTTFSTFSVEAVRLLETHHAVAAVLYVAASAAGGMVAVVAGALAARAWPVPAR